MPSTSQTLTARSIPAAEGRPRVAMVLFVICYALACAVVLLPKGTITAVERTAASEIRR